MPILIIVLILSLVVNAFLIWRYYWQDKQMKTYTNQLRRIQSGLSKSTLKGQMNSTFLEEVNQLIQQIDQTELEFNRQAQENRQLISSISHDFRTPLTSIIGYLQMVEKAPLTEKQADYLAIALERAYSLNDLIEEFYQYSILESVDDSSEKKEWVQPGQMLQEEVAVSYLELKKAYSTVNVDLEDDQTSVLANPKEVKRIFSNLVKNAYSHGQDHLEIWVENESDQVSYYLANQVEEDLSAEQVERLFERLYKVDSSRKKASTGLGLSIAKKLAEKNGFTLKADYQDHRLTFILQLVK